MPQKRAEKLIDVYLSWPLSTDTDARCQQGKLVDQERS